THFINHDILPVVPSQGSVGASGDLAPLSHIALALMGEGLVSFQDKIMTAQEALTATKGKVYQPAPKEGLSLINGTQVSTALAMVAVLAARTLMNQADEIAALSVEASLSSRAVFAPEIHSLKAHGGQQETARRIYDLLAGSEIVASHADCDRTQDPYSIRCVPHVHGASRDTLEFVESVILAEANSVSDNPLILPDGRIVSSGHFHGESVAQAMDALAVAMSEIGAISERRIHYFMKGIDDKIPPFLTPTPGLESGLMLAHVTATALASENKTLSHPASVDSLPSSGGQEDLVSMAPWAARKTTMILDNVRRIIAIELLTGLRAIQSFLPGLATGQGTGKIIQRVSDIIDLPSHEFSPGPVIEELERLLINHSELAVGHSV
ncbi:MAG: histidine ammonia-lyase, partial [Fidelibacterota bacterium]